MKYALIAVVVLLSWSQPAVAFQWTTLGSGNDSCGTWTKESRQGGSLHYGNKQWVLGFVTAAQMFLRRDLMRGLDNEGLLGWIDNHCRDNPTQTLTGASLSLVGFLDKRRLSR